MCVVFSSRLPDDTFLTTLLTYKLEAYLLSARSHFFWNDIRRPQITQAYLVRR
jgi:hypothetical protein